MKYQSYQAYSDLMAPMRLLMQTAVSAFFPWASGHPATRAIAAASEMLFSMQITHTRPGFHLNTVQIGKGKRSREVAVHEEVAHAGPFGTLLHFRKEGVGSQPKVLIVAPLSGHFASLLRETVRVMLADHDVYITDWHNARDVPPAAGRFDLEDYARYLITFLEVMGQGAHVVAICQSCVAALAAVAIMAEDDHPAQPRSLTLMGGPIDPRVNPTQISIFANSAPIEWFEKNFISVVPMEYSGAMRRVCPGYVQLAGLMSVDRERHMNCLLRLCNSLIKGDQEEVDKTRTYYEEYFAVLDLTAEFYLSTLKRVFQEPALPTGKLRWGGRVVHPAAIKRTALLTVEGELDQFCAAGQTAAAHALCSRIPRCMKFRHVEPGVGHGDLFSGERWIGRIYPVVRNMIYSNR